MVSKEWSRTNHYNVHNSRLDLHLSMSFMGTQPRLETGNIQYIYIVLGRKWGSLFFCSMKSQFPVLVLLYIYIIFLLIRIFWSKILFEFKVKHVQSVPPYAILALGQVGTAFVLNSHNTTCPLFGFTLVLNWSRCFMALAVEKVRAKMLWRATHPQNLTHLC